MERKIGEIFEHNGEWYQCIKGNTCNDCAFYRSSCGSLNGKGSCKCDFREDATNVVFKKLEKVGEPFSDHCSNGRIIYFQRYKCYQKPIIEENIIWHWADDTLIDIEIKQNKEYMEEEKHSNFESTGKNLKPFDLEKAKAGKPVYTRDGRKARIICFDRFCCDEISTIVACVMSKDGKDENVIIYNKEGFIVDYQHTREEDLMMLPEKHEGWVNVYKGGLLDTKAYDTKKDAFDKASPRDYIATVKIEWEE